MKQIDLRDIARQQQRINSEILKYEGVIKDALNNLERVCRPVHRRANIEIPRGIVQKVKDLLPEYHFIKNNTIQKNICYAVQSLQFSEWVLSRFKIYGPIKSYLVKTTIVLANMVVETITREFIQQKGVALNQKHSKNISKLKSLGVSVKLISSIDTLRTRRDNIHLHLVKDLENDKYKVKDWYYSLKCLYDSKSEYTKLLRS